MKKKCTLRYDILNDYATIEKIYCNIMKTTKHKSKLVNFDLFKVTNINMIIEELKSRSYKHGRYNIFLVKEPKYRIVMSECIKDKVVNHLVSNLFLKPVIYPKLIEENVATRLGKGTDAGIMYCKRYFLRMMNKFDEFYILKFDIHKFFYSIDHKIVKRMLQDMFEDDDIYKLMCEIIDSTNSKYINEQIEKCIEKEKKKIISSNDQCKLKKISELNRIPLYKTGKGLGIGELTSQVLGIFYLNSIDHFIKEKLGIREYVRYMDDGIVFSDSKEKLLEVWKLIEKEVGKLNLKLNDKTRIYSSKEGFEFVGYRFLEKNGKIVIKIKKQTKKRMQKKVRNFNISEDKLTSIRASYKGFFQYCTVKRLYKFLAK